MSAFTEANRKAFDDLSASYNTKPWQVAVANQAAAALQARKDWFGAEWLRPDEQPGRRDVRLLDYACGTGAITKALGPWVSAIRGMDISANMVTKYNEAARSSGLSAEQAHAVVGNLLGEDGASVYSEAEWHEFDVAAIGLGFHHFEDPQLALRRLGERLKAATGVLVIVDFLPFDHATDADASGAAGAFPHMQHTIKHNGFTGEQMRDLYQAAGFEDFDIVALKQPAVMELASGTVKRTLFIAKGRKVATAWQKLGNWIGGMQDWAADGMRADRRDATRWQPGFANDNARADQSQWRADKQKEETYDMFSQHAPRKNWTGF